MKKIIAFLLSVLLVLSLAGCGGKVEAGPTQVEDPENRDSVKYTDYEDTLEGLCEYMADLGYAYDFKEDATGDEAKDPISMRAQMIGAERGYKFTYGYDGKTGVLELYFYTNTDNQWYEQIKEEGKLTVAEGLDGGTVEAVLSDNGKYVMIHSYEGKNEERMEAIKDAFKGFYPDSSLSSLAATEDEI